MNSEVNELFISDMLQRVVCCVCEIGFYYH